MGRIALARLNLVRFRPARAITTRVVSAFAALLMLGASASAAFAEEVTVIRENGMPVSLAEVGMRYRSALTARNPDTVELENGVRVEVWKLQARRGQCLDIAMRSGELDSLLLVYSGPGFQNRVGGDDDSGGGQNGRDARVQLTAPANGSYYIVAAPASRNEPEGRYQLEIGQCAGGSGNPNARI